MAWPKYLFTLVLLSQVKSFAAHDASDVVKAYVGASMRYDSNLYRRSDNAASAQAAGLPAKSDTIVEARAGLKIDKQVSRQTFALDLNLFAPRYSNSTQINYTGWKTSGAWNWAVGDRVNGNLSYSDSRGLSGFDDVIAIPDNCPTLANNSSGQYVVDLYRDRKINFDTNWLIGHNARLSAVLSRDYNVHNQRPCLDQTQNMALLALAWISDQGNEFSIYGGRTWVEYEHDQQLATLIPAQQGFTVGVLTLEADGRGYLQDDVGVDMRWRHSPRTEVGLRWGRSQLEFDGGSRGPGTQVGKVSLLWRKSSKTTINLAYERMLESGTDRAGRNLLDNWSLRLDWAPTVKTSVYAETHYFERDYDTGSTLSNSSLKGRRDTDVTLELGTNYHPIPALVVTGWIKFLKRDANVPNADYDATLIGITSQWWF